MISDDWTGVKHALWTDPLGNTHNYFFSWLHQPTSTLEVDWLDARNICRRHCMDAVSLETLQENEFIKQQLARCKSLTSASFGGYIFLILFSFLHHKNRRRQVHLDQRSQMRL